MDPIDTFTVLIDQEASMQKLGSVVGKNLFLPLLSTGNSLALCAFGHKKSGKTSLFDIARETVLDTPMVSPFDTLSFSHHDFGGDTYPCAIRNEDVLHRHGVPIIDKRTGRPRIFYLEHPPVPHLFCDVAVVVSNTQNPSHNSFYLEGMAANFLSNAPLLDLAPPHKNAVKRIISLLKNVSQEIAVPQGMRSITMALLSQENPVRTAFGKTRNAVENNFCCLPTPA